MFAPYCTECGTRVLMGTRRILRLSQSPDGRISVLLRCFCGFEVDSDATAPAKAEVPKQAREEVCV
ncbi:MAG: hypothetical protein ACT4QF_23530 [Sporichthyaceae bacterium]